MLDSIAVAAQYTLPARVVTLNCATTSWVLSYRLSFKTIIEKNGKKKLILFKNSPK